MNASTTNRRGGGRVVAVLAALATVATLTIGLAAAPAGAATGKATASGLSGVVNVNTASAEELQLLPGVGESRASAILELRKSRGAFGSVDDLMDVKGIGPSMLERMRPHLAVKGRTTARKAGEESPAKAGESR